MEFIDQAYDSGADVHRVTQLATSLLGLVVFPFERKSHETIKELRLKKLQRDGWPHWQITLGSSDTLGDIIYHLRNAVAHGHITFSSDDRDLDAVAIEVSDHKSADKPAYWRASIRAIDLKDFCYRFIDLLEHMGESQLKL
jgi:hypothetical protein